MPRKKTTGKSTYWKTDEKGNSLLYRYNKNGERAWAIRVSIAGKKHFENFGVGQRAKIAAQKRVAEIKESRLSNRAPVIYGDDTFGKIAEEAVPHLVADTTNPKDRQSIESRIRKLAGRYGHIRLNEITANQRTHCQMWLEGEGLSKTTINYYNNLFSRVLNYAVAENRMESNPLKGGKRLRVQKGDDPNALTPEEWRTVQSQLRGDWFADVIVSLVETGMRRNELKNLRWTDIDFENSKMIVHRQTKNNESKRAVPMTPKVRAILKRNQKRGAAIPFPSSDDDKPFSGSTLHKRWDTLRKKIGGNVEAKRIHDLRHSFAKNCMRVGVPLTALQRLMGHARIEQTAIYARFSNEEALGIFAEKMSESDYEAK